MRLVLSIVSFCLAVILLGAGMAQRTIFLQPGSIVQTYSAETDALYTVVTPEVLAQNPGAPTVSAESDTSAVVAYGRTSDVLAWIGQATYTEVFLEDGELQTRTVEPDADAALETQPITGSPAGSDLWLAEGSGEGSASVTANIPAGFSAIVASNGENPAPAALTFAWPVDNSTPWVGPFLVIGALMFTLGGVLFWLHWKDTHRSGPRRKGPTALEQPQRRAISASKAPKRKELGPARGRRGLMAVALTLAIPVALSGCSAEYWPAGAPGEPTPTATDVVENTDGEATLHPAVIVPQMERILGEISAFATATDASLAKDQLPQRFAGPALAARSANYDIRAKKSDYAAPAAIPAQPLEITLPQQVEGTWPRLVMTVSQNPADTTQPPVALVLLQNSPRDNYHVYYAITLVPNAQSPQLAPATIGAPRIPADSKLLKVQPNQLAVQYADILNQDAASSWIADYLAEGDTLREQLGKAGQDAIRAALPANAAISFTATPGSGPALALATNDAGAIVSVQVDQQRKITPTDGGVVGFAEGSASAALSGFTAKSARGVQSTSGLQLLFYVPSVDSAEPVRLLGWTEGLIAASEIPG